MKKHENHVPEAMPETDTTDEMIMNLIVAIYNQMGDEEKATWSYEEAVAVINDQILIDAAAGRAPLPYDADDFYDTILELIKLDEEEGEL